MLFNSVFFFKKNEVRNFRYMIGCIFAVHSASPIVKCKFYSKERKGTLHLYDKNAKLQLLMAERSIFLKNYAFSMTKIMPRMKAKTQSKL